MTALSYGKPLGPWQREAPLGDIENLSKDAHFQFLLGFSQAWITVFTGMDHRNGSQEWVN